MTAYPNTEVNGDRALVCHDVLCFDFERGWIGDADGRFVGSVRPTRGVGIGFVLGDPFLRQFQNVNRREQADFVVRYRMFGGWSLMIPDDHGRLVTVGDTQFSNLRLHGQTQARVTKRRFHGYPVQWWVATRLDGTPAAEILMYPPTKQRPELWRLDLTSTKSQLLRALLVGATYDKCVASHADGG